MDSLQFQKCTLANAEQLRELSLTTFVKAFGDQNDVEDMEAYCKVAFSAAKIKEELSNEQSIFYFVKKNEVVVGYFKLNIETAQSEPIADGLEIERIYILSAYQSMGIGQLMFNKIFELAKTLKRKHLWLGVWEKNDGAIRFYERNGFKAFAKHDFLLGKDLQTDLMMELILVEDSIVGTSDKKATI